MSAINQPEKIPRSRWTPKLPLSASSGFICELGAMRTLLGRWG